MSKEAKHSKKLGRPEEVTAEELLGRFKALERFLEDNWGRIGQKLQRVRKPDDVRAILTQIRGVESFPPFRDHPAVCLIQDGTVAVGWRELRLTRRQYDATVATEGRLWSEHNSTKQRADEASVALKAVLSQFELALGLFPFFFIAALVAKEWSLEQLNSDTNRVGASLKLAQKEKQVFKDRLSRQEAWYAQNEIVRFVGNTRFEKTPMNFAKAMAGLPQFRCFTSFRKSSAILDRTQPPKTGPRRM